MPARGSRPNMARRPWSSTPETTTRWVWSCRTSFAMWPTDRPRRPRRSARRYGWSSPSRARRRLVEAVVAQSRAHDRLVGRLVEDVRLQEREDPFERVAPGLALLPAVAFLVVPLDFVPLALDLERLDHPLGHHRHDPLVLAAVDEQERRLDPFRPVDGRPATIGLEASCIVRRAHHLVQIEPAEPVPVAIAFRDLRIAIQVDAGAPEGWLFDEGAEDHVATI